MVKSNKLKRNLTLKQRKFCELYTTSAKFFSNGTQSYIEAYQIKRTGNYYKSAMSSAARTLRSDKIIDYINELLDKSGFNDQNIEKQHLFLINQFADLSVKRAAIADYYKLRGRFKDEAEKPHLIKIIIERADGRNREKNN